MVNFSILKQTYGPNANILEKEEIEDYFPETNITNIIILKIHLDENINFTEQQLNNTHFKEILDMNNADLNIETQTFTLYIEYLNEDKDIIGEINNFLDKLVHLNLF